MLNLRMFSLKLKQEGSKQSTLKNQKKKKKEFNEHKCVNWTCVYMCVRVCAACAYVSMCVGS